MGWGSATPLFDAGVDVTLEFLDAVHPTLTGKQHGAMIQAVVERHYTRPPFGWEDWDTQDESKYYDPYLRNVMIDLGEIDPDEEDGLVRPD